MNEIQPNTPMAIIPKELVRSNGRTRTIPCGSPETHKEASVELIREGDRVVGMVFRCACGNSTTVSCEYE